MPHNHAIKASIIGITGYTGLELLRILNAHPNVELVHLTSRQHDNTPIGDIYPHLAHLEHIISNPPLENIAHDSDVVFIGLPHGTAQNVVAELHGKIKVIDLSADYRLDDLKIYQQFYGDHAHSELLKEVVYGLPEITGVEAIQNAQTVANPGCFALLGQMLLYPFQGQIDRADLLCITGSSGSGKSASEGTHHPIRNHNIKSYNINHHRHIPEIVRSADIAREQLNFIPTSGPFTRGIFGQAFITLTQGSNLTALLNRANTQTYTAHPFVRTISTNNNVALANVVGSNFCDLSFQAGQGGRIVAQGAIDNLVKGAAGCAVQNMNIMFGFDQTQGLIDLSPLYP